MNNECKDMHKEEHAELTREELRRMVGELPS